MDIAARPFGVRPHVDDRDHAEAVRRVVDPTRLIRRAQRIRIRDRSLGDDVEIAEKCLQNRVITVPGVAFGSEAKGFLRISFCNTEEKMIEGVDRMKEALTS